MTVVITMPPASGGQTGYCGNFNNNKTDDYDEVVPSFHRPIGDDLEPVDPSESILGGTHISNPDGETALPDPATVMADCSDTLKTMAEDVCKCAANTQLRE